MVYGSFAYCNYSLNREFANAKSLALSCEAFCVFHTVVGLINTHIELEAHDLAQSVLGEFLLAHLNDGDLLVRNCVSVVVVDVGLEMLLNVGAWILFLTIFSSISAKSMRQMPFSSCFRAEWMMW